MLRLLEKGVFSTTLAKKIEQVAAILRAQNSKSTCCKSDEALDANEEIEVDDDGTQDETDEDFE